MKLLPRPIVAFVALCAALSGALRADTAPSGYVDLGKFSPPKSGGQFVEVNLKGSLLALAAKVAEKEEPEVGELLRGIESVRVNVVGMDDQNRADIQGRVKSLRTELETLGWERIVTVQQDGQDVGVFIKTKGTDSIAGLVVTVLDGQGQAVFINIVGDIKPEKLAELGERLHLDPLKKAAEKIEKK